MDYRIAQPNTDDLYFQSLKTEVDRTGTGKLTFSNSDFYQYSNSDLNYFPIRGKEKKSSKIVFPKEKRDNNSYFNRILKSLNSFSDFNTNNNFKTDTLHKGRIFFPQVC